MFGGRRKELAPLVYEAKSWQHGVLIGASVASETTAAAIGDVGVIRRDPMAMKPFCGYNFADYWRHWLSFEDRSDKLPKIFHVNWFRRDTDGRLLWPGFGENLRVLRWVIDRCEGRVDAALVIERWGSRGKDREHHLFTLVDHLGFRLGDDLGLYLDLVPPRLG